MSSHDEQHPGPRGGGGRLGAVRAWAIWWALCMAVWMALVDRVPLDELMTGVVVAALGATAASLVRRRRSTLLRPRLRWLRSAWRPLLALVGDLVPLARAVRTLAFDAVGDDPELAAFRVLTTALGSLGPNTIVLEVDADAHLLYAHQLVPTDDPARKAMPLEGPPS